MSNSLTGHIIERNAGSLALAAIIAMLYVLAMQMPVVYDDLIYQVGSGKTFHEFWGCSCPANETLGDALASCYYHAIHSNGRLSDKLLIIMSLYPLWIARLLCISSYGLALYMLARMAGTVVSRSALYMALMATGGFVLIGWSGILPLNTQFNYLLPTGLGMLLIYKITRDECRWWLWPVALAAGWSHEAFGLAIGAGLLGWCIMRRFRLGRGQRITLAFFLVGILLLMLAPGTHQRMHDGNLLAVYWPSIFHNIVGQLSIWAALASGGIYLLRKGRRAPLDKGLMLVLLLTVLVSLIIPLMGHSRPRGYFYAGFMFYCIAVILIAKAFPRMPRWQIPGALVTIGIMGWLGWIASVQHGYTAQYNEIRAWSMREPQQGIMYYDAADYSSANPLMMQLPIEPLPDQSFAYVAMAMRRPSKSLFYVLPEKFRGVHYSQWPNQPKGGHMYGSFPIYYVPGKFNRFITLQMTSDVSNLPWLSWALPYKLKGENLVDYGYNIINFGVAKNLLTPQDTLMLKVPGESLPDTLNFIYIEQLPRPVVGAPIVKAI